MRENGIDSFGDGVLVGLLRSRDGAEFGPALDALARSDLGQASVLVLDVVRPTAFPEGPDVAFEAFPTALGPSAARNWLLLRAQERGATGLLILEAGALPGAAWLSGLLDALLANPQAASAAATILDADGAPLPCLAPDFAPAPATGFDLADAFARTRFSPGSHGPLPPPDVRLYRTSALAAVGEFDLRFSTLDYALFDHDLRCLERGFPVLAVPGVQARRTGVYESPQKERRADRVKLAGKLCGRFEVLTAAAAV